MIKARATAELRAAGRADRHPRRHHADGARRVPRQPPAAPRACPACTARSPRSARCRSPTCSIALGARFDDRVTGKLRLVRARTPRSSTPTSTRPRSARTACRRADRGRLPRGDRRPDRRRARRARAGQAGGPHRVVGRSSTAGATHLPARLRRAGRRHAGAAVRDRAARQDRRPGRDLRRRRRPAPDVGRAVHRLREPGHLAQLRRRRHDGLRGAGRDGRQGRPARTPRCGRSTATAASR